MKKWMMMLAAMLAAVCLLAGCAGNTGSAASGSAALAGEDEAGGQPLRVVATIFPAYDWAREIVGESGGAQLDMLVGSGVDMHSYQPSAADMLRIAQSDLFIYVGGSSDAWVEDVLAQAGAGGPQALCLMDLLEGSLLSEQLAEGMQHSHEHEQDGHGAHTEDEHVWLSLRNAQRLCEAICEALCGLDEANAAAYRANTAEYCAALAALDGQYAAAVAGAQKQAILVADRFPFLYLAQDYGLACYAAFAGCEAEAEASFETVAFLAGQADALGLEVVLTIENSDQKLANTVVQNTAAKNQRILTLDSMQAVTAQQAAQGASYLGLMEQNLAVLQQALA